MLYQTFVTASFGFVAWNTMIRRFGATALHSFVFIMPVSGVFLGVTLLGEPITANLIGSIVFVVTGLIVVNRKSADRPG
jgi:drug/metabolite transporter (DMT)-like permease